MKKLAYLEIASHFAWSNKLFGRTKRDYCLEMQVDDVACNESKFNLKNTLAKLQDKSHKRLFGWKHGIDR